MDYKKVLALVTLVGSFAFCEALEKRGGVARKEQIKLYCLEPNNSGKCISVEYIQSSLLDCLSQGPNAQYLAQHNFHLVGKAAVEQDDEVESLGTKLECAESEGTMSWVANRYRLSNYVFGGASVAGAFFAGCIGRMLYANGSLTLNKWSIGSAVSACVLAFAGFAIRSHAWKWDSAEISKKLEARQVRVYNGAIAQRLKETQQVLSDKYIQSLQNMNK